MDRSVSIAKKLKLCNKGHQDIAFTGELCPLCEIKQRVRALLEADEKPGKTENGGNE